MSESINRNSVVQYGCILLLAGLLCTIIYLTPRENFNLFISQYLLAFAAFYIAWLNKANFSFKKFVWIAIGLRLLILFAVPQLSNDFYRFIWDGEIMTMGINPYAHTPDYLMSHGTFMADPYLSELFLGMGDLSQNHHSCYPVLNQILFLLPASLSNSIALNVIILKVLMILADIGVIFIGRKILLHLKKDENLIWIYALNPFVILEFTGNVHFEGIMIFFLMASMWYLLKNNWLISAMFLGCAVQIKLIPLILIPFVFKRLKWFRSIGFTATVAFTVIAMGLLMLDKVFLDNMWTSIQEYFLAFEFNASIYYLVREYDFYVLGWNNIAENGPLLSKIAAVSIVLLALLKSIKKNVDVFTGMMFAFVIYYALATTVHPWYIGLVLIFSVFTSYKFGLVWSAVVMLSYSAYASDSFAEQPIFLWVEYIIVYLVLIIEVIRLTKRESIGIGIKEFFTELKQDEFGE